MRSFALMSSGVCDVAGGIDWFRWHHGSVTDPKFGLIARRVGVRVGDAIAVWAFILEQASASTERGTFGPLDFETMDFLLGLDAGRAADIVNAMEDRLMIRGNQVARWNDRQPKRERDPGPQSEGAPTPKSPTQRSREHRERMAAVDPDAAMQSHATPCNATRRQETPRGEESREEESKSNTPPAPLGPTPQENPDEQDSAEIGIRSEDHGHHKAKPLVLSDLVTHGLDADLAAEFIAHRVKHRAPITPRAWASICKTAEDAGWPLSKAIEKMLRRGWRGLEVSWLQRESVDSDRLQSDAGGETAQERKAREKVAAWSGNTVNVGGSLSQPRAAGEYAPLSREELRRIGRGGK